MILIGQYDSPFVRRVGIALTLYDIPYEHRPWSAFGNAEELAALNPLMRVPTLILNEGTVLNDSHMMLDYLDSLVDRPLFPRTELHRHRALRVASFACGLADKAVSLFYERRMHVNPSSQWEPRLVRQIDNVLALLEAERAVRPGPWWFGDTMGHADIALACAVTFATEAHPGLINPEDFPAVTAHTAACEALAVFRKIRQPFLPPA